MPPYTRSKKTARLIYEPSLQGYSLSFSYNRDIVEFIKKTIPSHKRTTSGPPDWTWYFGSEYFDLIKLLFDGHREYTLTIVTQAEVEARIKEQSEASTHNWQPAQYSIDDELQKFYDLLLPLNLNNGSSLSFEQVKNWNKTEAQRFYKRAATKLYPRTSDDKPSEDMYRLNSVWAILKEGYYIK